MSLPFDVLSTDYTTFRLEDIVQETAAAIRKQVDAMPQFEKSEHPKVLLPYFSCHNLRHTFTTRMVEAGVNVKVIHDALGHKSIQTTLNIYADVTKELRQSEFEGLDKYFKNGMKVET